MTVRPARADEVALLAEVEDEAATRFDDQGDLGNVDTTLPVALLADAQRNGRLWVAVGDDAVVGFAVATVVDGEAHLREIDVLPAWGGRGLGRALVEAVAGWAAAAGMPAVTLTTFTDVAWNAPWYARLGFSATDEVGPELAAIVAEERAVGLNMARRCVMRRPVREGV